MYDSFKSAIIAQQLGELELSDEFKTRAFEMGFNTLGDIVQIAPDALLSKKEFNYNWFGELITFLSDRKLLHLLQPLPGSNPS
jgi:hypothetical protein